MPMIYNDINSAIELWDNVDEGSEVFLAVKLSDGVQKNSLLIETMFAGEEERKRIRVFFSKDEADSYRIAANNKRITLAKTTIGHLIDFLDKHCGYVKVDKKVECVLTTVDIDGKYHQMDMIWNNYESLN